MKRALSVVTSALFAVACGASNTTSAIDPSSTTTTAAPMDDNSSYASDPNEPPAASATSQAPAASNSVSKSQGAVTLINPRVSNAENITASIRKGIVGDTSLSFVARNVKIITVGTKVTLTGPVKTDAERSSIETRARQTADVTDVDDQIQVKQ